MDISEIRFLEGPNLFLARPAVKIEVVADDSGRRTLASRLSAAVGERHQDLDATWHEFIESTCEVSRLPRAEALVFGLDEPDHLAFVFEWSHRPFATAVADLVRSTIAGDEPDLAAHAGPLREAASQPPDGPRLVWDGDRSVFTIAVTGTNGKTTTTRLLAHIARAGGRHVGWSSSTGVYVDGELIEAGDYSGPSGAEQVLTHGGLDLAVLETARGGILLKGLGYESNDVSVFTNVSGDHLGLNGVHTVETLARVKSVVCRATSAAGVAVVNADDDLVLRATSDIRAARCLVSRSPENPTIVAHAAANGLVVVRDGDFVVARRGDSDMFRIAIGDIPMCFGGRADHQIENAMSAIGAALAAGLPVDAINTGLSTFGSDLDHNPGRLNVFDLNGYTVVLDYAHNEAGLERLLAFGRELGAADSRLIAVIGSAGDRDSSLLMALGRIAAEKSDHVVAKGTERYLRGIDKGELFRLYREGANVFPDTPYDEVEDEWAAVRHIAGMARPGDVFVLMFQELLGEVQDMLRQMAPA